MVRERHLIGGAIVLAAALTASVALAASAKASLPCPSTLNPPARSFETCQTIGGGTIASGSTVVSYGPSAHLRALHVRVVEQPLFGNGRQVTSNVDGSLIESSGRNDFVLAFSENDPSVFASICAALGGLARHACCVRQPD